MPEGLFMVRQSEDAAKLHRSLGQTLAAYRKASSLTQSDLARATNYDRTSIAHIEAGRQSPPERTFWQTIDTSVSAHGALVDQYDAVCDQKLSLKQDELKRTQATHRARADNLSLETVRSSHNITSPGDSLSEEGDHTERRDALRLGLVAAVAPDVLRRVLRETADDHPLAVRLRAQAARAHARQGQRIECEALFVEANKLYDRLPAAPPLHYGVDTIALADYALTSYPASAYIWLGDFEQAENCAQQAVALHQNVPVASRSPSREAIARIDLGIALAALGAPDEAVAQGCEALASSRVVDSVCSRAGDLAAVLASRYPRLPESQQFQDQVRELTQGASR
jgi:transcriptional regulator with XRE-family HTH domain